MASKAVSDAVEALLGATWTATDGNQLAVISLNGQGEPPSDGSPFIAVTYPVSNEQWFTVGSPGSNTFKEDGAFRIILNEKRGIGLSRAQSWVDQLRTLYRGITLLSGALQCFEAPPAVINDANDLGNYFQFSFAVRYRYFFQG